MYADRVLNGLGLAADKLRPPKEVAEAIARMDVATRFGRHKSIPSDKKRAIILSGLKLAAVLVHPSPEVAPLVRLRAELESDGSTDTNARALEIFVELSETQEGACKDGPRPAVPQPGDVEAGKVTNWHFAEDKSRYLRQVVLLSDPERTTGSRFSSLMLSPAYYQLMNPPLATGFFRLDGDPGPYLMIRTDGGRDGREAVDEMAKHQFCVALSFVHLPTSGLIAVFVSGKFLKDKTRMGYLEQFYGLDDDRTRALISDVVDKDALQVVLAGDGGAMPRCRYDIGIPFDAACKRVLADEWRAILAHHQQIRSPDFQAAGRRLYELIPEGTDPIIRGRDRERIGLAMEAPPFRA
jgi:hypothetical protein